jgi:hypothetical protein
MKDVEIKIVNGFDEFAFVVAQPKITRNKTRNRW